MGVVDLEQVTRGTPWHNTHEDAGKDVRVVARDIECDGRDGASCQSCQLQQSTPAPSLLIQPCSWPTWPWSRLHLDYAGPIEGKIILVLIDAPSLTLKAED